MEIYLALLIILVLLAIFISRPKQKFFIRVHAPMKKNKILTVIEKHDDDPENVHDSQVVKSLTKKYFYLEKRINELDFNIAQEIFSAAMEISQQGGEKVAEIINEIIARDATITSFDPDREISEMQILFYVWWRINHKENIKNQAEMKNILFLQIKDMIENNILVCTNGRVSRMLSVFTLLDSSPELSSPEMDDTELTNVILAKIPVIINETLNEEEKKIYNSIYENNKMPKIRKKIRKAVNYKIRREFESVMVKRNLEQLMNTIIDEI